MANRALELPARQKGVLKAYRFIRGRRILDCMETLQRTQWLSMDELGKLQRQKLLNLLRHAYLTVPYYREAFDSIGLTPQAIAQDLTEFLRVPLLSKEQLREGGRALVTIDPDRRRGMSTNSSSGSTGAPVAFYQGDNFWDCAMADMYRYLSWCGWRFGEPHAFIMGSSVNRSWQALFKTWVTDQVMNSFRTHASGLTESRMMQFVKRILRRRPTVIIGYPSALTVLAEFVRERELDEISFKALQCTSEVLYPSQRALIEEVFRCPAFDRYGCREIGDIAHECEEHRGYHIGIENNYVEVIKDGQPVKPGEIGEIVVTNLNNYAMPFIRYQTGDIGVMSEAQCECGRGLPMLERVAGRRCDVLLTTEGNLIPGPVFADSFRSRFREVERFQVEQIANEHVVVRIVTREHPRENRLEELRELIREVVGPSTQVDVQVVDQIPLSPSGKHHFTISRVGRQITAIQDSSSEPPEKQYRS